MVFRSQYARRASKNSTDTKKDLGDLMSFPWKLVRNLCIREEFRVCSGKLDKSVSAESIRKLIECSGKTVNLQTYIVIKGVFTKENAPKSGIVYQVTGRIDRSRGSDDGITIQYQTVSPLQLQDARAIQTTLQRNIEGCGPALAKLLADHYGNTVFDKLANDFNGVSTQFPALRNHRDAIVPVAQRLCAKSELRNFLLQIGLEPFLVDRVIDSGRFSSELDIRSRWQELRLIDGIGDTRVLRVCDGLGIAQNDPYRIRFGVNIILTTASEDGHTCLDETDLIRGAGELLQIGRQSIVETIRDMINTGHVYLEGSEHPGVNELKRRIAEYEANEERFVDREITLDPETEKPKTMSFNEIIEELDRFPME